MTSIAHDPDSRSLFVATFGDGTVKIFDKRLDEDDAVVKVYQEHSSWVHGVRWQRGSSKDLVSAR